MHSLDPTSITEYKPRLSIADAAPLAILTFVVAAVASVGAAFGVAIIAIAISAVQGATTKEEFVAAASAYWAMLGTIVVSQLAMAAVVVAAWWCTGAPFRKRIGFTAPRVTRRDAVVVVLAGGVPFAASLGLASLMPSFQGADAVLSVWSNASVVQAVLWVAVIGIFPGVIEESLFRGMIQRGFMRSVSPILAIALTSFLFALLHIDPPAMALALTLGVWLGFVAWRTGSIVLTVLTHFLLNAGWNIAMMLVCHGVVGETTQVAVIVAFGVVTLCAFIWSIPILKRAGHSVPVSPASDCAL